MLIEKRKRFFKPILMERDNMNLVTFAADNSDRLLAFSEEYGNAETAQILCDCS